LVELAKVMEDDQVSEVTGLWYRLIVFMLLLYSSTGPVGENVFAVH
jgi:hypothetical protein